MKIHSVKSALVGVVIVASLTLASCSGAQVEVAPSPDVPAAIAQVTVGKNLSFKVEIADDPQERDQGLSGRESIAPGTGMYFEFQEPSEPEFWMPDMAFSLDLGWIRDGTLIGKVTMHPCTYPNPNACDRFSPPGPIDSVIEVPEGELGEAKIGDQVVLTK